jgi:ribose transport system permease protein
MNMAELDPDVEVPPVRNGRPTRKRPTEWLSAYALVFVWAAVIVVFGIVEPSKFLTSSNAVTIFGSQAVLVVLMLGLLIPLTVGDYDLSVAGTLTLSSMLIAVLNVNEGWPLVAAIAAALAAGALIGWFNGALIVLIDLDPFIVTLGTGTLLSGIVYWISDSATISGISHELVELVLLKRFLGLPLEFFYGLILAAIMWYVLERTPLGKRLLFVGRGREVSRLSGLRVGRIRWGAFITSGFVAALAGVLYAGNSGGADPSSGASFLLPAYAAAFLGATAIIPGRFNAWGSFIAVYFLVTGITGLQLLGVDSFVQQLFYGGALVIAVSFSAIVRRQRVRTDAS